MIRNLYTLVGSVFFLGTVFMGTSNAEPQNELHVGYFNFPPHVDTANSRPVGAAVRFFELVVAKMGEYKLKYSNYPINRIISKLDRSELDVGLYFAKTPERANRFIYSAKSFDQIPLAIAVLKQNPMKRIGQIKDLYPLTIGYAENAYLSPVLRDDKLNFEYLSSSNWIHQNIEKVLRGRLDAALSGYYQLKYETSLPLFRDKLRILKIPHTEVPIYTVFSKSVPTKIVEDYNKALLSLLEEVSYKDIFQMSLEPQ